MYAGMRDGLAEWFSSLGYDYDPALHGVVSDWALDLVACGSHKPARFYGPKTMVSRDEVVAASAAFVDRWLSLHGAPAAGGRSSTVRLDAIGSARPSSPSASK